MSESPKSKLCRRILRTLLIWLASFTLIALATGIALLTTDSAPKKLPDIVWSLLFGVVGASVIICLLTFLRWLSCWRNLRRASVVLAVFATLIAIFYTEEDWRGKHNWEKCKAEMEAKGFVMDWNKYIPPAIPDGENIFKAPKMTEWFVRGATTTNSLYEELKPESLSRFTTNDPIVLAEWTWQPLLTAKNIAAADSENADLVLRYSSFPSRPHRFTDASVPPVSDEKPDTNGEIIPTIQFQDVPITTAIESLARMAGINYLLDPKIGYDQPDKNGRIKPEPTLSVRWENVTAREALLALLDNYDLQLIEDPNTGIARVTLKNSNVPQVYASPDLDDKITRLLQNVIGPNIIGARGDRLLAKSPAEIKPARIILLSGIKPDREIIAWFTQCFPTNTTGGGLPKIHIEPPVGTVPVPHTFRVILDSACSSADFLAWSDKAGPDFNLIREALKRPAARMDGNYSVPYEIPILNFITVRAVAQVLAQRAQCHFLLNQPEQALDDLTLMHDLRGLMQPPPSGKPETPVAAMINVAVMGLYASEVEEGFQKNVWQEPQLVALQKQLADTDLVPWVEDAMETEPVAMCRELEIGNVFRWENSSQEKWNVKLGNKVKSCLWPRGWTYQNMVTVMTLDRPSTGFDADKKTISPKIFDQALHDLGKALAHKTPYNVIAGVDIRNFTKAWQVTAHNQTMLNEAQIACALERYRIAHGEYPETLDALVPQFIGKLPHDLIGGQPLIYRQTDGGKFLLYSIGWNETDDGGQGLPSLNSSGAIDYTQGDWVWKN